MIWKMPERILKKKIPKEDKKNIKMLNLLTSMHPYYVPMSFSYGKCCLFFVVVVVVVVVFSHLEIKAKNNLGHSAQSDLLYYQNSHLIY